MVESEQDPEGASLTNTEPDPGGRIVVGVDGSPSCLAALDWAGRQAEMTKSVLHLITAWNWPAAYGTAVAISNEFSPALIAATVLDSAEEAVHDAHPSVEIHKYVQEGHAASVLVNASKGATMLVVGCRGHGEFAGMLLGSVSEHCATNAHCPVLVFRSEE
jgi:nucleotide-binding universal stress UspA family protein